jgi:hypothetical protein
MADLNVRDNSLFVLFIIQQWTHKDIIYSGYMIFNLFKSFFDKYFMW